MYFRYIFRFQEVLPEIIEAIEEAIEEFPEHISTSRVKTNSVSIATSPIEEVMHSPF